MKKMAPVSIRLVDNKQFQFGQALKPPSNHWSEDAISAAKKWYVLNVKNFDPLSMVAATLLFEGSADEVKLQEKRLCRWCERFCDVHL
jgi:alkyldihydroxyacetonephosphate synthase